jgi:hypothetical protein
VTTEPESGTPEPLRGLGPDDPRFWDAFVVVSEEKIGNVTLRRNSRPAIPESTATYTSRSCPILRATPRRGLTPSAPSCLPPGTDESAGTGP